MVAMDVDVAPAHNGSCAEQSTQLPIGSRVNFGLFQKAHVGAAIRVGGRLAGGAGDCTLLTTDGGSLKVLPSPGFALEDTPRTFVELVGTKAGDTELRLSGMVSLPGGEVDAELWDEAVKLMQVPQLRDLFAPRGANEG